jgi:hypothetical protein
LRRTGWGIGFGVLLALAFLIFSPERLKRVGDMLLFVPEKLGLIERVSPNEIRSVTLYTGRIIVQRFVPGRYLVFTNNIRLFHVKALTDMRTEESVPTWLTIRLADNSMREVRINWVNRGLRLYDTPHAKGRPVLRFNVSEVGVYEILFKIKGMAAAVSIVPDRTSGNELFITKLFLIQIAIVLAPLCVYAAYRLKRTMATRRRLQKEQRLQADEFMARYGNKHHG